MKKDTWSFYRKETGEFTGSQFSGSERYLEMNTPEGTVAISGAYDRLEVRFDLTSGKIVPWIPPKPEDTDLSAFVWNEETRRWESTPTELSASNSARQQRDSLLKDCDWTQMPDVDLSTEEKAQWRAYRQALRDITDSKDFPWALTWPLPPNKYTA